MKPTVQNTCDSTLYNPSSLCALVHNSVAALQYEYVSGIRIHSYYTCIWAVAEYTAEYSVFVNTAWMVSPAPESWSHKVRRADESGKLTGTLTRTELGLRVGECRLTV